MFARLFTLAILTHCVIGRFTPNERQWNPEDAKQNCTLKCEDECIYCEEPNKCSDSEKKCGEEPPEKHPDCPPDEICIPDECLCKSFLLKIQQHNYDILMFIFL